MSILRWLRLFAGDDNGRKKHEENTSQSDEA